MLGWLRFAAACASRRNRSTNEGSRANSGNSAFSATRRFSDSSRARYTSAMPPRASSRSMRYRFEKTWPTRDIVAKPYLSIVQLLDGVRLRLAVARIRLRPQQRAQHLRGHGRRDAAAGRLGFGGTAVLDEHRDRVLRI